MSFFNIAEMACSHEGDTRLARKIIDGAGQVGADAIQFQIWVLQKMMVPHHPDIERVARIAFSQDQWTALMKYVRQRFPKIQICSELR